MKNNWAQIIVHVDMDAFFASVEQLHHPEWRGKPVIVGADPKEGRGRGERGRGWESLLLP